MKDDHWLAISCLKCVGTGRKDYNTIHDCLLCDGHGTVPCAWWIEMKGAECEREDQAEQTSPGGSPAFRWFMADLRKHRMKTRASQENAALEEQEIEDEDIDSTDGDGGDGS